MATIYQDSAGIRYLGKFLLSNDPSTFRADLGDLFETDPKNSNFLSGNLESYSFNNEPVGGSKFHIQIVTGKFFLGVRIRTSASSSGTVLEVTPPNGGGFTIKGTYAVFGKGVLAWFDDGRFFMIGEAEVSAFPPPLNRFFVNIQEFRKEGFWVNQLDSGSVNQLYVDEPQASFSINCSGGGTADATWLKLLDQESGKAMGICEGTVMQTEGTSFTVGEVVQVDAPLPDGGSRLFICVGPWGDDGQVLMRIAENSATPI